MSLSFQEKLQSNYYSSNAGWPYVSAKKAKNDPNMAYKRQKYIEAQERLIREFKNDAFEELGIVGHPKAETLFNIAWQRRGSFNDTFIEMEEMIDLIK